MCHISGAREPSVADEAYLQGCSGKHGHVHKHNLAIPRHRHCRLRKVPAAACKTVMHCAGNASDHLCSPHRVLGGAWGEARIETKNASMQPRCTITKAAALRSQSRASRTLLWRFEVPGGIRDAAWRGVGRACNGLQDGEPPLQRAAADVQRMRSAQQH